MGEPAVSKEALLDHFKAVRDWSAEVARNASALAHQCQQLVDRLDLPESVKKKTGT